MWMTEVKSDVDDIVKRRVRRNAGRDDETGQSDGCEENM